MEFNHSPFIESNAALLFDIYKRVYVFLKQNTIRNLHKCMWQGKLSSSHFKFLVISRIIYQKQCKIFQVCNMFLRAAPQNYFQNIFIQVIYGHNVYLIQIRSFCMEGCFSYQYGKFARAGRYLFNGKLLRLLSLNLNSISSFYIFSTR